MEKLQQDSIMPLEQHKQDVLGAIEAVTKDKPKVAVENNMVTEAITNALGGSMFSALVTASEEGRNNNKANRTNSLFVGGGVAGGKAAQGRTSLLPKTYSEKKEDAKLAAKAPSKKSRDGDVYARSNIASQSLTGETVAGEKPCPIKGTAVTPAAAKAIEVKALMDELAMTNRVMNEPYQDGSKRLEEDLKKGVDNAEKHVAQRPQSVKQPRPAATSAH